MINRPDRSRRGSTFIELALAAPLFLLILAGCFQYGYYFFIYNRLENSVRAGARYAALRGPARTQQTIRAQSARNRFPGVVTRLVKDRVAAQVEVQAGPHRLVALITREAVEELGLVPGSKVVAVVKATSVMVELPK